MLIQVQIENEQDQVNIFQYIYFEIFQIHQKVIKYHFEHIDHDIYLAFFILSIFTFFLYVCNQYL